MGRMLAKKFKFFRKIICQITNRYEQFVFSYSLYTFNIVFKYQINRALTFCPKINQTKTIKYN